MKKSNKKDPMDSKADYTEACIKTIKMVTEFLELNKVSPGVVLVVFSKIMVAIGHDVVSREAFEGMLQHMLKYYDALEEVTSFEES